MDFLLHLLYFSAPKCPRAAFPAASHSLPSTAVSLSSGVSTRSRELGCGGRLVVSVRFYTWVVSRVAALFLDLYL